MLKITVCIWVLLNIFCIINAAIIQNGADNGKFNWTSYQNLDAINSFLDDILQKYPKVTKNVVIGKSYENRPIRAIQISYKPNNPGIFIESTIHAREWIVPATTTYFINELLSSKDTTVRQLAENHDWYIIPVLNVDGYIYTFTTDRDWRKNRQPTTNASCIGTDLNRNFNSHWREIVDDYSVPCGINYPGAFPYSAPEVKAEVDYFLSIKDRINIFFAFHNSAQQVLAPYDYTQKRPPNYKDLKTIGRAYINAIKELQWHTKYQYGESARISYLASGESNNWAYEEQGIELSYLIEMRDTGFYDHKLPPDQIIPNSIETLEGMKALIKRAHNYKYMDIKY